jgi:hypothetical protein
MVAPQNTTLQRTQARLTAIKSALKHAFLEFATQVRACEDPSTFTTVITKECTVDFSQFSNFSRTRDNAQFVQKVELTINNLQLTSGGYENNIAAYADGIASEYARTADLGTCEERTDEVKLPFLAINLPVNTQSTSDYKVSITADPILKISFTKQEQITATPTGKKTMNKKPDWSRLYKIGTALSDASKAVTKDNGAFTGATMAGQYPSTTKFVLFTPDSTSLQSLLTSLRQALAKDSGQFSVIDTPVMHPALAIRGIPVHKSVAVFLRAFMASILNENDPFRSYFPKVTTTSNYYVDILVTPEKLEEAERAFDDLKSLITSNKIVAGPNLDSSLIKTQLH